MSRHPIDVGDIVSVYWDYVECEFNLEVLDKPWATGDSWKLRRKDGTIVYVNSFAKMVRNKS